MMKRLFAFVLVFIFVASAVVTLSAPALADDAESSVPVITKQPSGENVNAGTGTSFIARATGATTYTWRVKGADGSDMSIAEAEAKYTGIVLSGDGTEKLVITSIPASVTGSSFYCVFSNAAGSVTSDGAKLTVIGAPAVTPAPATPTPEPTEAPVEVPADLPAPAPEATPEPEQPAAPPAAPVQQGSAPAAAWKYDNASHWHAAADGSKADEGGHLVNSWEKQNKDLEAGTCRVCGASVTREVQAESSLGKTIAIAAAAALVSGGAVFGIMKAIDSRYDDYDYDDYDDEEYDDGDYRDDRRSRRDDDYYDDEDDYRPRRR